jgi:cytochrome c1
MKKLIALSVAVTAFAAVAGSAQAADTGHHEIVRQQWSFSGFKGQYDKAQLQRGFQVYKEVCAACHGLSRVAFRNLSEPGGPGFPEAAVKTLAAEWPNQIPQINDAGEIAKGGDLLKRPALPSDPILGPYLNDKQARAAQNGTLPPDLSLVAKARGVHRSVNWMIHPFLMLGDIFASYQEGGADYLFALLTGYHEAPAGVTVGDGMNYNTAFPGNQLAMPPPLSEGVVTYQDGTKGTVENYARDVSAFLAWAADPSHDQRKRIGWQVMLYLLVTTALLYVGKKRVWSKLH